MHRVEFIGAGPGHPDLLTLGGLKALAKCPAVLAPLSFQRSLEPLLEGKEMASPFQMDHRTLIAWIESRLALGSVAFLLPGDLSTFCPFQSFVAHFGDRARVIPGVGAHAAAAAVLKKTFDLPGIAHATVLTSPRAVARDPGRVRLRDYARPGHTLVIYMNDMPMGELVAELSAGFCDVHVPIAILERLFCPGEKVTRATLGTVCDRIGDRDPFQLGSVDAEPALTLVAVGEALGADEDPSWWDYRHERIWKPRGIK